MVRRVKTAMKDYPYDLRSVRLENCSFIFRLLPDCSLHNEHGYARSEHRYCGDRHEGERHEFWTW